MAHADPFNRQFADLSAATRLQDQWYIEWVQSGEPNRVNDLVSYTSLKGESFTQPAHLILTHVLNHGTYHRGQVVTILRQLGIQKIPATDFILWSRTAR